MGNSARITVNGKPYEVEADPSTPLLYVLRNELGQKGPRFGCGLAQCGACTVHVGSMAVRSCMAPLSSVEGQPITTLDGLAATSAERGASPRALHVVQQAFIDEQAAQCGYCINGWIMTAAALLEQKPRATDAEIRQGLSGLKCRCGSHMSILRAVKLAAKRMARARG
jgi:aerobic-type carbon monoxide dehydrogenase small subunit (CoxS/CutS family)